MVMCVFVEILGRGYSDAGDYDFSPSVPSELLCWKSTEPNTSAQTH